MLDGLKTFPLATGLTDSEKMIEAEFGIKGYAVLMKLYQAIYSRGYYMKWDIDTKLLFIRDYYLTEIGGNLVSEIVAACVRREVFDSALYEQYQILTSSRIEETFLNAKQRSAKVIMDKNYALPIVYTFIDNANKKGKNVNIFFKNADSLSTFSDKGKERKEKENTTHTARTREDNSSCSEELKELPPRTVNEDFSKRFSAFVNRWNIEVDTNSPLLADFDFGKLDEAFSKSEKFLQRYSSYKFLSWIVKNYNSIIKGKYDDHKKEEGAESKPKIKLPWDEGDIVVLKAGED